MFYFGKYGPEVLLFCERPCLTAVEARRRTLWDGKRRVCPSVSSSWQFLAAGQTARREPRSSCGPEDTRTSGTRERCGGLENGSGEVKKKKKNGQRADCLDERYQSKLLFAHRRSKRKKSHKKWDGVFTVFLPCWSEKRVFGLRLPAAEFRTHAADQRTSVVRIRFHVSPPRSRNRPWCSERADRARACRYRNTLGRTHKLYGERKLLKLPRLMRAERWHVELWLTSREGRGWHRGY